MKQVRVNVTTKVNMAAIKREKLNGRDVIIVPSATLPDGVVMNGIKYPADEIESSFASLERTPAPYGHPMVNNAFVSASDPEGLNAAYIGAWNQNVRRESGRVWIDKVIDVDVANRSESGRDVLKAIEDGSPIHTSTGLLCVLDEPDGDDHEHIAREIEFDHDAILLNEEGAATPEQGVGMMVNASGVEIQVINSRVEWAENDLAWAAEHLLDSAERLDKAKARDALLPRLIEALRGVLSGGSAETNENVLEENVMDSDTKEAFEAINAKVDGITTALTEALKAEVSNAVKPLVDAQAEMVANEKAKEDAELADLQSKIVKANLLDEETAAELTLNAARKLAEKAKPGKAAGLNSAFTNDSDEDDFKLPKSEEAA